VVDADAETPLHSLLSGAPPGVRPATSPLAA